MAQNRPGEPHSKRESVAFRRARDERRDSDDDDDDDDDTYSGDGDLRAAGSGIVESSVESSLQRRIPRGGFVLSIWLFPPLL